MTEQDWLTCIDPQTMLEFLRGKASARKLRLFACGCCRRIWPLLTYDVSRKAVEVAEDYSDGQVSSQELEKRWRESDTDEEPHKNAQWAAFNAARNEGGDDSGSAAYFAAEAVMEASEGGDRAMKVEQATQCQLVRCISGNPFRPVTLHPSWLTPTVMGLAETIYTDRAFDRLPILADVLEEAGCHAPDILGHCRQPGAHVRACWVVDLILGKE